MQRYDHRVTVGSRPGQVGAAGFPDRAAGVAAASTVNPKPSAKLFWVATAAWRCSAFTNAAFSSQSGIGRHAR